MSRILRLVLAICVLACGVHVAEPVQAHAEWSHHAASEAGDTDGSHERDHTNTHGLQHHCPVALDQDGSGEAGMVADCTSPLFAAAVAPLSSRSQAPPLQPPAA